MTFHRLEALRSALTEVLAIPLYPSVAFRLLQVPVCAVVLVYMFDVLLAVFVVVLAERVLDIDIELAVDMELDVGIELNVDGEIDAGFDVELGMVFVEPDTDSSVGLEVIVAPAFTEVAGPTEDPALAVDARLINEPILRLETALLPEELGTQHSARSERSNNDEIGETHFGTLANRAPPGNEEPPITAGRSTHTHTLAVRRTTCSVVDASGALRGCN